MTTKFRDTFENGEQLSPRFLVLNGSATIGGGLKPDPTHDFFAVLNSDFIGLTFSPDQAAKVRIPDATAITADGWIYVGLRAPKTGTYGYEVGIYRVSGAWVAEIFNLNTGAVTTVPLADQSIVAVELEARAIGSKIYGYVNGKLAVQADTDPTDPVDGQPFIDCYGIPTTAPISFFAAWDGLSPSIRERIVEKLVALLEDEFRPAGLQVFRERLEPLEESELPAIVVYCADEPPRAPGDPQRNNPIVERTLTINLESRAIVPDGEAPDATLDPLIGWATRQILENETFGGLATNAIEGATSYLSREKDSIVAAAVTAFSVKYRTSRLDPSSKV